jgi:hypothetical protein
LIIFRYCEEASLRSSAHNIRNRTSEFKVETLCLRQVLLVETFFGFQLIQCSFPSVSRIKALFGLLGPQLTGPETKVYPNPLRRNVTA